MKRASKNFHAVVVWPLIRRFILYVPHRRLKLLLGSWILAAGLISCGSDKSEKKMTVDTINNPKDSVSDETCYRTVVKDSIMGSPEIPGAVKSVPATIFIRDTAYMECYAKVSVDIDSTEIRHEQK